MNVESQMPHWIRTGNVPKRDEFGPAFQDDWMLRLEMPFSADAILDGYRARRRTIRQFGFALPCREAVDALKALSPIVEVAAGTGAWACLLAKNGVDIVATDRGFRTDYGFCSGRFYPVARMDASVAIRKYPDRNVLMIWPCYSAEWPTQAIQHIRCGRSLALVSEGNGGCCGADSLFERLGQHFRHVKTVRIPCWDGIHDRLDIYRRAIVGNTACCD